MFNVWREFTYLLKVIWIPNSRFSAIINKSSLKILPKITYFTMESAISCQNPINHSEVLQHNTKSKSANVSFERDATVRKSCGF